MLYIITLDGVQKLYLLVGNGTSSQPCFLQEVFPKLSHPQIVKLFGWLVSLAEILISMSGWGLGVYIFYNILQMILMTDQVFELQF